MAGATPPRGAIALGAYKPNPALFTRQLRSIQTQSVRDWICYIGADGGLDDVRRLTVEAVGDDDRFRVLGWDGHAGMYLNYERILGEIPRDAAWVAPSDHDDFWLPDKLERLLAALDGCELVAAQASVVTWPHRRVLAETTDRRWVPFEDLVIQNQVSGGLCIFKRSVLDLALPFPRYPTITQVPDHWLALCASASGSYRILPDVVQEYVQHADNFVGERAGLREWVYSGTRHLRTQRTPTAAARELRRFSIGWRTCALDTLAARGMEVGDRPPGRRGRALDLAWRGLRSRNVSARVSLPIVAGALAECLSRTDAPGLRSTPSATGVV